MSKLNVNGLATLRQKQKKYSETFEAAEAERNARVVFLHFICWLGNTPGSAFEYGLKCLFDSSNRCETLWHDSFAVPSEWLNTTFSFIPCTVCLPDLDVGAVDQCVVGEHSGLVSMCQFVRLTRQSVIIQTYYVSLLTRNL